MNKKKKILIFGVTGQDGSFIAKYLHNKNWIQPYYIERFYDIADEYLSEEAGYNLKIIVLHMDALYANSDNQKIPVLDAMRVVSLMQDGLRDKANLRLLQLQRKY